MSSATVWFECLCVSIKQNASVAISLTMLDILKCFPFSSIWPKKDDCHSQTHFMTN